VKRRKRRKRREKGRVGRDAMKKGEREHGCDEEERVKE
jgi:hypothetical protein